jgi:hypothetical protein
VHAAIIGRDADTFQHAVSAAGSAITTTSPDSVDL